MTNEELWRLFPIALRGYDSGWPAQFGREARRLDGIIGKYGVESIVHIGSTAVEGLAAKPIVDIIVKMRESARIGKIRGAWRRAGIYCLEQPQSPRRIWCF